MSIYVGLGKTKYNSSVCISEDDQSLFDTQIYLTERINKKKNSGLLPVVALKTINEKINLTNDSILIAENRDVHKPREIEDIQDQLFPFYQSIESNGLERYFSKYNDKIQFVTHHLAHAYAALAMSPFEKSLIIVLDGAGSEINVKDELVQFAEKKYEECTVFLQEGPELTLLERRLVSFRASKIWTGHTFGNQVGSLYEKVSEYVFNSPNSSGKVMGLAPFYKEKTSEISDLISFQESLNWNNSFKLKSKKEWEESDQKEKFIELSAIAQKHLENVYEKLIIDLRNKYPMVENLILTGGCALNCTNNAKIYYSKLFNKIYVPPFPGDESIGFGLVNYLKIRNSKDSWVPLEFPSQSGYFGPKSSVPNDYDIEKNFSPREFVVIKESDIISKTAVELSKGKIIAWFQGRSESGPRALGNRSILASPLVVNLKNNLNKNIKFREEFRPYGCSVAYEKAHEYFEVESGFNNPYMSFAIRVRKNYLETLKEVCHVDGTSRMQTVREGQNHKFHRLITRFGEMTNLYCLLNTSLNIMDQPILEDIHDAKLFLQNVPVDALVINDYYIQLKKS